jgi:hypothetical protein
MNFYFEFNIIQMSRISQLGMITIAFKYRNTNIYTIIYNFNYVQHLFGFYKLVLTQNLLIQLKYFKCLLIQITKKCFTKNSQIYVKKIKPNDYGLSTKPTSNNLK